MTTAPLTPSTAPRPTRPGATAPAGVPTAPADLRRLRWAIRATLALGVAASVAANILHADQYVISQIIAAWPPVALLLTLELISRVPTHRRCLAVIRLAATAAIAGIAAWVSYWHMAGVAAHYGERGASSYLLPISVDGLVIVASISLIEITDRIRATSGRAPTMPGAATPAAVPGASVAQHLGPLPSADAPERHSRAGTDVRDASVAAVVKDIDPANTHVPVSAGQGLPDAAQDVDTIAGGDGPVPADTAAAVAYWHRRDSHLHPAQIAARIGRSERTVRRYWPPTTNGAHGSEAS